MFLRIVKLVLIILISAALYSKEINLEGITYTPQTWNNCAPASLSMMLSFFDIDMDQKYIESHLKTYKDDVHIGLEEIVEFISSNEFNINIYEGISVDDVLSILDNEIPVMVPIWHIREDDDQMGHYILVNGYDSVNKILYIKDPLDFNRKEVSYSEFDRLWRVFNRTLIVIYPGSINIELTQYSNDEIIKHRQEETIKYPEDFFSWYNMGTLYLTSGDLELSLNNFQKAMKYDYPTRFFWYNSKIFEAYYLTEQYKEIIGLSNTALRSCLCLEEVWYWRAKAQYGLGMYETSLISINKSLQYRSTYKDALDFKNLTSP